MQRSTEFVNAADEGMAQGLVAQDAVFHVPGQTAPVRGTHLGTFLGLQPWRISFEMQSCPMQGTTMSHTSTLHVRVRTGP